jgi:hypothetical protein
MYILPPASMQIHSRSWMPPCADYAELSASGSFLAISSKPETIRSAL